MPVSHKGWASDCLAGFSVAMVALPVAMGGGLIAMAPLGPAYVSLAVKSGLICALLAALVTACFGSACHTSGGPSNSTSIVLASALAGMGVSGAGIGEVMLMLALIVCLSGAMLVFAGWIGWGSLVKYIPRPVTSGFMTGGGILLILSQVHAALGATPGGAWTNLLHNIHIGAVCVSVITFWVCVHAPRWQLPIPPALLGLLAGSAAHYVGGELLGPGSFGHALGRFPALSETPLWWGAFEPAAILHLDWVHLVSAALLVTLMSAVQTLMTAQALDALAHSRHDANQELIGFGLGNVASGLFGGVASSATLARAIAAYKAGGQSRRAGGFSSVILLGIVLLAGDVISYVPLAAMAGVLIQSGVAMIDPWSLEQAKAWFFKQERGDVGENVLVILLMLLSMVWLNPVVVVALGVTLSMLLFVRRMSSSLVRRSYRCDARRSLKVRPDFAEQCLLREGQRIHVVELDGPMFFGSADRLRTVLERDHADADFLILDCRRVRDWDATGIQILGQIRHACDREGRQLLLSHILPGDVAVRLGTAVPVAHQFEDTDHAIEFAEDILLGMVLSDAELKGLRKLPYAGMSLFSGLSQDEQAALLAYFEPREYVAGEALFRMGDEGECLFVLLEGEVTLGLSMVGRQGLRRLAVITPGVMFGEMSLIDALPRSADAVAGMASMLISLPRRHFLRLQGEHPALFAKFMRNIAHEMSMRLRLTNRQLGALES
ncbi:SulP family inorganic anion transporter [Dechloromonas sp. ZS-1]|uniref:SulP family inorganic anion transporter n=1 Tax=Dechloromonas sp. ZS-1 TaxID=3138067 RepID=UPI0031FE23E3